MSFEARLHLNYHGLVEHDGRIMFGSPCPFFSHDDFFQWFFLLQFAFKVDRENPIYKSTYFGHI